SPKSTRYIRIDDEESYDSYDNIGWEEDSEMSDSDEEEMEEDLYYDDPDFAEYYCPEYEFDSEEEEEESKKEDSYEEKEDSSDDDGGEEEEEDGVDGEDKDGGAMGSPRNVIDFLSSEMAGDGQIEGSIGGISQVIELKKVWTISQALANIAFGFPFSIILFEIQYENKNGECVKEINDINFAMRYMVQELNQELADANFIFCDAFEASMEIMKNRQNYGFEVTTDAYCGFGLYKGWVMCISPELACCNASNHLWWDRFRPTDAVNFILADNAWSSLHMKMCYCRTCLREVKNSSRKEKKMYFCKAVEPSNIIVEETMNTRTINLVIAMTLLEIKLLFSWKSFVKLQWNYLYMMTDH
ncbi:hypothetical protein GIB67_019809, partial [Kingdonia uniflora]